MRARQWRWVGLAMCLLAACGEAGQSPSPSGGNLLVAPQNSHPVVGVNRLSVALLSSDQKPVVGATEVSFELAAAAGVFERGPLEAIGNQYGPIPVYVGAARFPRAGQYQLRVRSTLPGGGTGSGTAIISVAQQPTELGVGATVPALRQPIATDPGLKLSDIDSGVPPDDWHTQTIADGLAQHRPMVLYFGEPGFCRSRTCQPTVQILRDLCQQVCDRMLFEHIEDNYPAGPDETSKPNPAFAAIGLQSEPWIYFVNSAGVVADRFEGPVALGQLRSAAEGTLQGRVPAVDVSLGP